MTSRNFCGQLWLDGALGKEKGAESRGGGGVEGWVSGRGEESQERGEPALPHLPAALEVGLGGGRERSPRQGVSPAEGRVAQGPGGQGHMGW